MRSFLSDTKDLSLNNFCIGLIYKERNNLFDAQEKIQQILKGNERKIESDIRTVLGYYEQDKATKKRNDEVQL